MSAIRPQYDAVAAAYEELIAPRYRRVAELLLDVGDPSEGEIVLDVGAGTGGLARLIADRLGPDGRLVLTDISSAMLEVAASVLATREPDGPLEPHGPLTETVQADMRELPFADRTFDLVVAQFTPAQDSEPALAEMHRVLGTNGRLALAYWGPEYSELDLLNRVRVRVGLPSRGNPAPAAVQARLAAAGFGAIEQRIVPLAVHHASVADYLAYRAAFGRTEELDDAGWGRYREALEDEARRAAAADGSVDLTWSIVLTSARRTPEV